MMDAHDRSYKHSTPTIQQQRPGLTILCSVWVFVCQCVRQFDSA